MLHRQHHHHNSHGKDLRGGAEDEEGGNWVQGEGSHHRKTGWVTIRRTI